jgi:Methyltransferase FkbM domain
MTGMDGITQAARSACRDGKPLPEFKALLPRRPTIIEVGAHDGSTTVGFRRLFPRARILAFEPEPRAIAKFRARAELRDVTLLECAVADRDGQAIFHQCSERPPGYTGDDWDASGSIRKPTGVITAYGGPDLGGLIPAKRRPASCRVRLIACSSRRMARSQAH